jgi:hypothetical protein
MSLSNPLTHLAQNRVSPLCRLPLELRTQIYRAVFHPTFLRESDFMTGESKGGRYGEGLSRACKQLYTETRHYYFYYTEFIFRNANNCEKFLQAIGNHVQHLGTLELMFDLASERDYIAMTRICYVLKVHAKRLFRLHLNMPSSPSRYLQAPLYWPNNKNNKPAEVYDLQLRPSRHHLAEINTLRIFTVVGHPNNDMWEEAIFKVIASIQQTADRELKQTKVCMDTSHAIRWVYAIAVDGTDWEEIRLRLERGLGAKGSMIRTRNPDNHREQASRS